MRIGLNYMNASPNAAAIARFKTDRLAVSTRIYWNQVELAKGVYSFAAYKPLFDALLAAMIPVDVTLWNQFQSGAEIPSFYAAVDPSNPFTIVTNSANQTAWLNFINYIITQLRSYPNIVSWTPNNEPFYPSGRNDIRDGFVALFPLEVSKIRALDFRPVHSRFMLSYTPASGLFPATVYTMFDVFGLTNYLDGTIYPNGTVYNATWPMWEQTVLDCVSRSLKIAVKEFGVNTNGTSPWATQTQAAIRYAADLSIFINSGILDSAFAWSWNNATDDFDIWDSVHSVVYPAYNTLISYAPKDC